MVKKKVYSRFRMEYGDTSFFSQDPLGGGLDIQNSIHTPSLVQNGLNISPNPFNPIVNIAFKTPTTGLSDKVDDKSIAIVDLNGRQVFAKVLGSNEREVIWNASALAPGFYVVNGTIGHRRFQKRILLQKLV